MSLMEVGHFTIIGLLLGILHGIKFRVEVERDGDGRKRYRWRVYFADRHE